MTTRVTLLAVEADEVSAGPLGLLVVVLMILATVLLIRNMNARLRRLPREFPDRQDGHADADERAAQGNGAPQDPPRS